MESEKAIEVVKLTESIDAIVRYMPHDENTVGFIGLICNRIKSVIGEGVANA